MRIILTFLLNAGLNFAVGLVIAGALGPERYGRFAVGITAATLLATGVFDWLRLSTTRYCGVDEPRPADPALRRTLDAAYGGLAILVTCGAVVAIALPIAGGALLIAAIALVAIANGLFDYRAALARALFRDGPYTVLVLGKGVLGLALACGAGLFGRNPALVLAAQGAGTLLAIVPVAGRLGTRVKGVRAEVGLLRRFAHYGLPVVAANVAFQGITLMVRSVAAATLGFAAAGHLALATDLELRLLLASGAAVDVLVFQLAVRSERTGGRAAAEAQLRTNMVVVAAVLALIAVGFAATLPAFTMLVVPARFQEGFAAIALVLLPGVFLFCLGQFALNPVFQMQHRTMPITVAAFAAAVTVGLGAGATVLTGRLEPLGFAALHAGGLGVGFAVLAVLVFRDPAMRPRRRDGIGIAAAACVTAACLWPLRFVPVPLLSLTMAGLVGPLAYGAVLLACDVGPFRALARPWTAALSRRFAAQRLA